MQIDRSLTNGMSRCCKFSSSPVTLLKLITGFRYKDQSFVSSRLGRILNAELLKEGHFIIRGMLAVSGRISDGNEIFETMEIIDVMDMDDEALNVKEEAVEVVQTVLAA